MNYTREQIEAKILTDRKWLERGIVAVFNRQTCDEQVVEHSKYHNLQGFSGPDAKRLTYYAKWILSGKHLSGKHVVVARERMKKYSGQLTKIANGEM
jgi:hypothetical protein